MEVNDSHNEVRIEHVIALNQHAKRLFPALYSIHKRLATEEYQFLYNKEKKDKKNAVVMTEEQAEEIGCLLRLPIAILFHFMNFQGKAHSLLLDCVNHSKQLDFTGNYIFSKPVAELFTNYVKLHIFLTQFDDLQLVISFYKQSLEITKKSESQGLKYLSEFLQERETLKPVEAELQFMSEHLASFFRSVGPSILPLLNEASLYDWSKITI
ncbi:hypothetical protein TRFO_15399 [Tritrichomonas foetus]|uniref:Uncharacterized protein n=1 Tax=Tritrichomonas foetus TaxID=1144522 RepID=A0A1J4KSI5_9EUKA|nr:hypothetical protein TRFO_15399 [Tritrichomonas foetus]|eukprot:OHT14247.1 hypothetical protein TRFO_15399 [Tritrichomonas foetus]